MVPVSPTESEPGKAVFLQSDLGNHALQLGCILLSRSELTHNQGEESYLGTFFKTTTDVG